MGWFKRMEQNSFNQIRREFAEAYCHPYETHRIVGPSGAAALYAMIAS